MTHLIGRRVLLTGAGATLLTGCGSSDGSSNVRTPGGSAERCRTPGPLVDFDHIGQAALGYEGGKPQVSMRSDEAFLRQLEAWATDWAQLSGLGVIQRVWSYGAYTDKCNSFHQVGRAFDIARLEHAKGIVSCRYDQWGTSAAAELRNYWRLAASLHAHFAYTLTYAYNAQHHNHIHVDNAVNGAERTVFNRGSRVQVHFVQHSLTHVHGLEVPVTAEWDAATKDALRTVQRRLGISKPLGDPDGWRAYLRATASA